VKKRFDPAVLKILAKANQIRIETRRGPGSPVHQTVIWVVVEGENVYVRSYTGRRGRWFREIRANPRAFVLRDGRRIRVRAVLVRSPRAIARASRAYLKKYSKSAYAKPMVRREILPTTLRLNPF
jgi:hypothetical protein